MRLAQITDENGKRGLVVTARGESRLVKGARTTLQLAQAAQVWVTPDSASMVYEALTSGATVGCFELPYARPRRVARGLERLAHEKRLTVFSDWERSGSLQSNDHPLNEAERCARQLLQWLEKSK